MPHNARNRILTIQNEEWVEITTYKEVQNVVINFYKKLFSEQDKIYIDKIVLLEKIITKNISAKKRRYVKCCSR